MSDDPQTSADPYGDFVAREHTVRNDTLARYHAYRVKAEEILAANKAALFPLLASAGFTTILVRFDGYGDDGQIEEVDAFRGDELVDLPDISIDLLRTDYGADRVFSETMPIDKAVETLCYAMLASKHGGWENNDGAFGTFGFDVTAGTIALDFNCRFTSSEQHMHLF